MKGIESSTCYHCESTAENREHVPPKCLFPKGSDWSKLITVPSCKAHNNRNSAADEYLRFILGASTANAPDRVKQDAARSAVRLATMRSRNLHRYGLSWNKDALQIGDDFPLDIQLLNESLEKIARGIYFHHHRGTKKLSEELKVFPLFIPLGDTADPEFREIISNLNNKVNDDFGHMPAIGQHQDVFSYQIIDSSKLIFVNMQFYGSSRATVVGQKIVDELKIIAPNL